MWERFGGRFLFFVCVCVEKSFFYFAFLVLRMVSFMIFCINSKFYWTDILGWLVRLFVRRDECLSSLGI